MATIDGTQGRDSIFGTPDPDEIRGLGDRDYIVGLDGNDNLAGNDGSDIIFGNQGDDIIAGGQDGDFIRGGSGNDDILGEDGNDIILGDRDNDNISGGDGNDILAGNQGADEISGGDGNDTIRGGQDNDTLLGGDGNDFLYGDLGADVFVGGSGNDIFAIGPDTGGPTMADADVVEDFSNGDRIGLADGLTIGQIRWTFVPESEGSITGSTVIQHLATQEFLAIVKGTRAGTITRSSFTTNLSSPPQPLIPISPTDPPDTMVPGNSAPVAEDLTLNLAEDAVFDARGSATDADGDELTFSLASNGSLGNVTFFSDGRFTYRANPNATGTDTFTYTANDGITNSEPATVTVNLSPVNDPPSGISLSSTVVPENSANDDVIATVGGSDPDGDTLTFSLANNGGGRFKLEGGQLKIANASLFDSEQASDPVSIRILARDPSGATFARDFVLTVGDEVESLIELEPNVADPERLAYTVGSEVAIDMSADFIPEEFAFNNSTLNVGIVEGGTGGDVISILSAGDINYNPTSSESGEVSYKGTVIGTVQRLNRRQALQITFNGSATEDALDAVLQQVSFQASAVDSGLREVEFVFADATGELSDREVRGITVNPVTTNSPPTANDATFNVDENSINGTNVGTVSATDPDGDALSYSITAGNTSPDGDGDPAFAINATTGQITVNDSGDLDFETTPTFNLTVEVQETGGAMQSDTATITINLNDLAESMPPVVNLPGAAVNYTSGGGPVVIDTTATVMDADSANFDTGTLTISLTAGATTNDRLAVNNEGTGAGQIGVSGSNITFGGTTIGTFAGGTGTTPLSVTLNANANPAATQALLRNIIYDNVAGTPSTTARTVQFQLTDGDGGTSMAETETINVALAPANDPPVINLVMGAFTPASAGMAYNFGGGNLINNFADPDAGTGTVSLTIALSGGAGGGVTYTDSGSGLAQSGTSTNLTLQGTIAQLNSALTNDISYTPAMMGTANFTFTLDDMGNTGTGGAMTDMEMPSLMVMSSAMDVDVVITNNLNDVTSFDTQFLSEAVLANAGGAGSTELDSNAVAPVDHRDMDDTFTFVGSGTFPVTFTATPTVGAPFDVTVTTVAATTGDDMMISGGAGPDVLFADGGNDMINGGMGNDNLIGGNNNDVLIGGPGNDTLTGNDGASTNTNRDSFRYEALSHGLDVITDFNVGRHSIDFNDGGGATFDLANFGGGTRIDTKVEVTSAGSVGTDITGRDVVFWNAGTAANASAIDTLLADQNGAGSNHVIVVYSTGSQTRVAYDTDGSTAGGTATDIAILSGTFLDGSAGNDVTISNLSTNTVVSGGVFQTFRIDDTT